MIVTVALLLALGLDTFAVAIGLGMKHLPRAAWLRTALTFAVFEGVMPAIGLLIGRSLVGAIGHAMTYVAGTILLLLGLWEIRESRDTDGDENASGSATLSTHRTWLLGLSVSLDELAVGLSLGVLRVPIAFVLVYVAVQAVAVTFLGLSLGRRVGTQFQERSELIAGLLFVMLGALTIISGLSGFEII